MSPPSSRKHPILAAFLALALGPIGLFYFGWPMGLISTLNVALFAGALKLLNFIVLPWMPFALLVILSLHGWATARWWNGKTDEDDPRRAVRKSLAGALLLTRGQLPAMGHAYALGIGFYLAFRLFALGKWLKGLVALAICPLLFTFFSFLFFRLISEGLASLAFKRLGPELPRPADEPGLSS